MDFTVVWYGDKTFLSFIAFWSNWKRAYFACLWTQQGSEQSLTQPLSLSPVRPSESELNEILDMRYKFKRPQPTFSTSSTKKPKLFDLCCSFASSRPYFPFASWSLGHSQQSLSWASLAAGSAKTGIQVLVLPPTPVPLSQMFSSGAGQRCTIVVWDSPLAPLQLPHCKGATNEPVLWSHFGLPRE